MARKLIMIFLIIVFLTGLYIYSTDMISIKDAPLKDDETPQDIKIKEGLKNESAKCPNMLVKKGDQLYLFNNTDSLNEPPIQFNNLDEYVLYVENQRAQGINCPIMFLQQENDVQGNDVYRIRPSIFDQQGGMSPLTVAPVIDSNRRSNTYNVNNYPAFDPYGLQVGIFNELDDIHFSTEKTALSDNPMDTNWGGAEFTQDAVESGKYNDNMVTKSFYFTPKTQFFPSLYGEQAPLSGIPPSSIPLSAAQYTQYSNYSDNTTVQPATVQPATVQPDIVQPATVQPATVQPATVQPAASQQATAQPATSQQATSQQATAQPAASKQATAQPAASKQATVQPAASNQATAQPATSKQATAQPAASKQATAQPAASKQATAQSAKKPETQKKKESMSSIYEYFR